MNDYLEKEQKKLNEELIEKISYKSYKGSELTYFDIDSNHPEKAFTDIRYYRAMKKVPLIQKKTLYLLAVCDFTVLEVAKILQIKPKQVMELKKQAIVNFKKNLKKEMISNV